MSLSFRRTISNRFSDYDQIYTDLRSARKLQQLRESVPDDEKPGMGQWHCVECAKYLESEHAYKEHKRGKKHKRMYVEDGSSGMKVGLTDSTGCAFSANSHIPKRRRMRRLAAAS